LLRRRLLGFGGGKRAAQFVSGLQRPFDIFVMGFAFEEDQGVAAGTFSRIAVLNSPCAIPKDGIAPRATNLN
jgi:hypothetical protein